LHIAKLLIAANRNKEAQHYIYTVLNNGQPDSAEGYYLLGLSHKSVDNEEALKCFEKAVQLNSNYHDAYFDMGYVLNDLNRCEEAIKCYETSIKIDPNRANQYNNLGFVLQRVEKYEDSIYNYKKSIQMNPSNSNAYLNMGDVLSRLNRKEEAKECYDKALKLNPNSTNIAYDNMDFILERFHL